ncbi:hypothetical protein BT96DRAFT_964489 [Gymnopus androsaceus JB14]|uniref:CHAT domain-containing protein n=1 Tax=Gymnopus androsaceus JB14 TaxID=1447944 RepID=A0A6A4HZC4_9AGAR|nr:hypothetical protein BT96DRAFT_964489 [Gymnopus androsaceus JB14]
MPVHNLNSTSPSLAQPQDLYDSFCANTMNTGQLNACIEICKKLMENGAFHDVTLSHLLGKALCSQAVMQSNAQNLDEGLELLHKVFVVSNLSSGLWLMMTDIASALHTRWDLMGILEDLQDSISLRRLALSHFTSLSSQHQLCMIQGLSAALFLRFTHFPRLTDLQEAIALAEQALSLSNSSADRFENLCTLAQMLLTQWDYDGVLHGREHAIILLREAVFIAPTLEKPLDWALALNGLSEAIQGLLFLSLEDIKECVNLDKKALALVPKSHPERALTLAAMATTLLVLYTLEEEENDWEQHQSLHEELAAIVASMAQEPNDQFKESPWALFQNIGHFIGRHALTSIFLQSKYIKHAEMEWRKADPAYLRKLGPDLFLRRLLDPIGQEARFVGDRMMIRNIPLTEQRLRLLYIGGLAWSCRGNFFLGMELPHLESRDEVKTFWLSKVPKNHPWEFAYYERVASEFDTLFSSLYERNLMDEALYAIKDSLELYKKAVDLQVSMNHPLVYQNMANLAWGYIQMAESFPNMRKRMVDEAIKYGLMTVQHAIPTGRLEENRVYAYAYITRFDLFRDLDDLDAAVEILRKELENQNQSANGRYHLADLWAETAIKYNHSSQMEAHISRINCLITEALEAFNMGELTEHLSHFDISDALATATEYCISNGAIQDTLYMLGRGRGVLWLRLLQLQHRNLRFLQKSKPNEVLKLEMLLEAAEMERKIEARSNSTFKTGTEYLNNFIKESTLESTFPHFNSFSRRMRLDFDTRRLLTEAWKGVSTEGLEDPTAWRSFVDCIPEGSFPVVVLNAAKHRCDALIIQSRQESIEHIMLPQCTCSQLDSLVKRKGELLQNAGISVRNAGISVRLGLKAKHSLIAKDSFEALLEDVWHMIVEPVVRALHLKPTQTLPHVWWYPTGPFWQVPLHAAGIYQGIAPISVQDYFVSSYLPAFNMSHCKVVERPVVKLLAVYQSETTGLPSLPDASREAEVIRDIVAEKKNSLFTELGDMQATHPAILKALPAANIVHFALHAQQDFKAPLESCLLLQSTHDSDNLKLSELMEIYLPNADLVFLSACETATGHKVMPEEVIHIAAAMLFVGFKGAIGTMWSIMDCDGPVVAQETYRHLLAKEKFDPRDAAYALHHAVKHLRHLNVPLVRWVPFIHIGI